VIFEESGPGAITRIWVTTGFGQSTPLPSGVRVRFYLDGEAGARLDLPLADLFSGTVPPFTAPLAGDQLNGGYFTTYRACRRHPEGETDHPVPDHLPPSPADRPVATFKAAGRCAPAAAPGRAKRGRSRRAGRPGRRRAVLARRARHITGIGSAPPATWPSSPFD
jgi:hypothetical protein